MRTRSQKFGGWEQPTPNSKLLCSQSPQPLLLKTKASNGNSNRRKRRRQHPLLPPWTLHPPPLPLSSPPPPPPSPIKPHLHLPHLLQAHWAHFQNHLPRSRRHLLRPHHRRQSHRHRRPVLPRQGGPKVHIFLWLFTLFIVVDDVKVWTFAGFVWYYRTRWWDYAVRVSC